MSNQYQKGDLAAFKERLSNGGYNGATGARRAVGKFQTWSKADKEKAHDLINAKFGEDGSKSTKKVATKAKSKAPAKRAVKRTPVNKKAAAAKKVDGRSKEARAAKKVSASNGAARTPVVNGRKSNRPRARVGDSTSVYVPGQYSTTVDTMAKVVGTIHEAITAMKMSRELVKSEGAKDTIDKELEYSSKVLGRAVRALDSDAVSPLSKDETKPRREPSNGRTKTIAEVTEGYVPTEEEKRSAEAFNRAEPNRVPLE